MIGQDFIKIHQDRLGWDDQTSDWHNLALCLADDLALVRTRLDNYANQINRLLKVCEHHNVPDHVIERIVPSREVM